MKNLNIKIRQVKESDYKSFYLLYLNSHKIHSDALPDIFIKNAENIFSRGTFLNEIEDENSAIFVAENKGKIIGIIEITIEKEIGDLINKPFKRATIEEVAVDNKYLRSGVGSALVKRAERWAKEKKADHLSAIVYDFNKKALKFHEKNGFKPFTIRMVKKI